MLFRSFASRSGRLEVPGDAPVASDVHSEAAQKPDRPGIASGGAGVRRKASPEIDRQRSAAIERARRLIDGLASLDPSTQPVTEASISECRQQLLELAGLNLVALPALEEFFQRRQDVRFEGGSGTNLLEASTLRIALMKLLFDFSAPDNEQFQARLLGSLTDPDEVSLIARQLEIAAPRQYLDLIVQAVRRSLQLARSEIGRAHV